MVTNMGPVFLFPVLGRIDGDQHGPRVPSLGRIDGDQHGLSVPDCYVSMVTNMCSVLGCIDVDQYGPRVPSLGRIDGDEHGQYPPSPTLSYTIPYPHLMKTINF